MRLIPDHFAVRRFGPHLVETNGDVKHVIPSTKVGALFVRSQYRSSGNE